MAGGSNFGDIVLSVLSASCFTCFCAYPLLLTSFIHPFFMQLNPIAASLSRTISKRLLNFSTSASLFATMTAGIVIPVKPDGTPYFTGSKAAQGSDISALWKSSNAKARPGESKIFYAQGTDKSTTLALVGTGDLSKLSKNELLERSRVVAAVGVKALRDAGCDKVSR